MEFFRGDFFEKRRNCLGNGEAFLLVDFGDSSKIFGGKAVGFGLGDGGDDVVGVVVAQDVGSGEGLLDGFDDFELSDFVDGGVEVAMESFGIVFVGVKDVGAEGVISVDVDLVGRDGADHRGEAVAHILTARVGKGDAEDVVWGGVGVF